MDPDLTLSIICTNNQGLLRGCLNSLIETTRRAVLEIYVVDNASTDGTSEMLGRDYPQVLVLRNETRFGFSSNNNLVLARARGRYVMLLNDDVIVLPGAVDAMVEFLDEHPEAWAAGGWVLNPDGSPQLSYLKFPHPVLEALHPLTDRWRMTKTRTDAPFEIDTGHGACLMVRRSVLPFVGLMDVAFDPIYSEETDWCYRIRQQGGLIYAIPQGRFIHFGGATMNRMPARRLELLYEKRALFFLKHHGRAAKRTFKVFVWLASIAKLAAWSGLLPFKRERARAEIPLHWHMVRKSLSL